MSVRSRPPPDGLDDNDVCSDKKRHDHVLTMAADAGGRGALREHPHSRHCAAGCRAARRAGRHPPGRVCAGRRLWDGRRNSTGVAESGSTGRVLGMDVNAGMVSVASEIPAPAGGAPMEFRQADACFLGLEDDSVDVVLSALTVQFVPEKQRAVTEMRRVVRPGGRVAVSVWGPLNECPYFERVTHAIERHLGPDVAKGFYVAFTLGKVDDARALFMGAGFRDVSSTSPEINDKLGRANEFIPGHLSATPVAGAFAGASEATRATLVRDAAEALGNANDVPISHACGDRDQVGKHNGRVWGPVIGGAIAFTARRRYMGRGPRHGGKGCRDPGYSQAQGGPVPDLRRPRVGRGHHAAAERGVTPGNGRFRAEQRSFPAFGGSRPTRATPGGDWEMARVRLGGAAMSGLARVLTTIVGAESTSRSVADRWSANPASNRNCRSDGGSRRLIECWAGPQSLQPHHGSLELVLQCKRSQAGVLSLEA
jgi:SAM-dependent methyltransferase